MNRSATLALGSLLAVCAIASNAFAQKTPPADLAPKMQPCLACHVVEGKKTIGPPYKEVAAKYAGQKDAEKTLVNSVLKGSNGKWGQVPMPPNAITEKDADAIVKWVLSLK